ncbi:hypothetical protein KKI19_04160 [Patescibacteria group bacterium]|nr:hypothetical protein [Patescibacteria group bacterium]
MKNLALTLPGKSGNQIVSPPSGFNPGFTNLNMTLSGFLQVGILVAAALLIWWFSWGVFQYIFAGGDKEALGRAQKRIVWAIIGFIVILSALALNQYLQTIFPQKLEGGVTPVTTPPPIP